MSTHPHKPKLSSIRHYLVKHRDALILLHPHPLTFEDAKTMAIKLGGVVTNQSWWDSKKSKTFTVPEFFQNEKSLYEKVRG